VRTSDARAAIFTRGAPREASGRVILHKSVARCYHDMSRCRHRDPYV